jgi:capsular polysaccharide biosynthesis protein
MNFIIGVILGFVVATIGFAGMAKLMDSGVDKTKDIVQKIEKDIK